MVEEGSGDLLAAKVDALVNAVNVVGVMGKGLALAVKKQFPDNFAAYQRACETGELMARGHCHAGQRSNVIRERMTPSGRALSAVLSAILCTSCVGSTSGADIDAVSKKGVCGNGLLEPGEHCDVAIVAGKPGSCPQSCDDGDACTADTLHHGGTCKAKCTAVEIEIPVDGDTCCPSGATASTDSDCGDACGDGVVGLSETCDIAIDTGFEGSCPQSCDDGQACTIDILSDAGTCSARCSNTPIQSPHDFDGCCPAGANANTDADCDPVCGNGVVEPGEGCDDSNTAGGDGCSASCTSELTAFRIIQMSLVDPHLFVPSLGCLDATLIVNTDLDAKLNSDANQDGSFDLNPLLMFRPLSQSPGATTKVDYVTAKCSVGDGTCTSAITINALTATSRATGICLAPIPGTISYDTPDAPTNLCFATASATLTVELAGADITLYDASVAARYQGDPATGLSTGLIRGFITKDDADVTPLPLLFGATLGSLLGGQNAVCGQPGDEDVSSDGVRGWYFYLNFVASRIPYKD
jgi:cysteine-rich repeat protein